LRFLEEFVLKLKFWNSRIFLTVFTNRSGCIWRFSYRAQKNMAEKNRTKSVSPTAVFRSSNRLLAAKRKQSCQAQYRPFT
jgi:YD repeat-containing protein